MEALQREVREEAGLHCEPVTLLSMEERGPSWIRFVFLARATGRAHLVALELELIVPFPPAYSSRRWAPLQPAPYSDWYWPITGWLQPERS